MPLYEYTCRDCGHEFEQLIQDSSEESQLQCPKCAADRPQKRWSLPSRPVVKGAAATAAPCQGGTGPGCGAPWCQRPNS
ncbi:FmdB family zinc ribbon protein [Tuwongella immobilis]|uniref:FmdB family zinc ribbon protein n=1 Tax=Tuwongella immobilis TaxID=692036 RepID=UPI0013A6FA4F